MTHGYVLNARNLVPIEPFCASLVVLLVDDSAYGKVANYRFCIVATILLHTNPNSLPLLSSSMEANEWRQP